MNANDLREKKGNENWIKVRERKRSSFQPFLIFLNAGRDMHSEMSVEAHL